MGNHSNDAQSRGRRKFLAAAGGFVSVPVIGRSGTDQNQFPRGTFLPSELTDEDTVNYVLGDASNPITPTDIQLTRETVLANYSASGSGNTRGAFVSEGAELDASVTGYAFALVGDVPLEYVDYEHSYADTEGDPHKSGDGIEAFLARFVSGNLRQSVSGRRTITGPRYDWELLGIIEKGPRTFTRPDYPDENTTMGKVKKRIEVWRADAEHRGKRNYHCITRIQSEDGAHIDDNIWTHHHSDIEQHWDHGHAAGLDLHNIDPAQNSGTEANITVGYDGVTFSFDVPYFAVEQQSVIDEKAAHEIGYPSRFLGADASNSYLEVGNSAAAWMVPPDDGETFLFVDASTKYHSPDHVDGGGFVTTIFLNRLT